jgi:hypothetical protein
MTTLRSDVTEIQWNPPSPDGSGPGCVTIWHRAIGATKTPMTRDDAQRLARRLLDEEAPESIVDGTAVHWIRSQGSSTSAGKT